MKKVECSLDKQWIESRLRYNGESFYLTTSYVRCNKPIYITRGKGLDESIITMNNGIGIQINHIYHFKSNGKEIL